MKDGAMVIFGGLLFAVLFHFFSPGKAGLGEALIVGLIVMAGAVGLRRLVGVTTLVQSMASASGAGLLIGLGLWWLVGRDVPWTWLAIPCALLGAAEAALEGLVKRPKSTPDQDL